MSMSKTKCCVPGCADSGGSHNVLHGFPHPTKDTERFNSWVFFIGGDILALDNHYIYTHRRVCHAHFEEKYCCRFNRISNIAVPTLNMPGFSPRKYQFTEQRALIPIQNLPSTSKGEHTIFGPDFKIPDYLLQDTKTTVLSPQIFEEQTSAMKENIRPLLVPDLHEEEQRLRVIQEATPSTSKVGPKAKGGLRIGKMVRKQILKKDDQKLYRKLMQTRIKLSKCRSKIRKQSISLKAAKNIVTNPRLHKTLDKLPSMAKLLIKLQLREVQKKNKGRRFNLGEKILALSIFKQAPKSYRFLRKILILPAPQTLLKVINQANINPGINKNIFNQIKNASEKMKPIEKLCIVMFDEMHLKANVAYNERKDKVIGFATDGAETNQNYADHAQVYMVRGLIKNYKQPVSYTFSAAPTSGQQIVNQLKKVITELQEAGLIVLATVCDQGSNNRHAIKLLLQETQGLYLRKGQEPKRNVFVLNNQEIVPLYDPPHLLKCIRNNLLTKNLQYSINGVKRTAKWEHITLLHNENPGYKGVRLIPKLTDNHVAPEKSKMKVKFAAQIFSRTVATNMGYLADKGILPKECKETADVLLFFDNLFDSQNGSFCKRKEKYAKPLLGPVTPTSAHHAEWLEAKKCLNSMIFINKSGKKENIPTIKNWVWTLDGVEVLLKNLETQHHVTSVYMRHLNQDPIENFFGAIRSHGCRNTNPTPEKFESAFTTLLINNLSSAHSPYGTNCEADNCETLHALIITDNSNKSSGSADYFLPNIDEAANADDPRVTAILNYISGYLIKKTKSQIFKSCAACKKDLISVDSHEYIRYREFGGRQWLHSPTPAVVAFVADMHNITHAILTEYLEKNNLKNIIKNNILLFADLDFITCEKHKDDNINFLLKLSTRLFIHNYVKDINKVLCGRRACKDSENDNLLRKAQMYFKKCYKRPINK